MPGREPRSFFCHGETMDQREPVYTHVVVTRAARRALVAIGACAALVLGMTGPVAAAGDPGHINGTVTGAGSAPLQLAAVHAYRDLGGGDWDHYGRVRTAA